MNTHEDPHITSSEAETRALGEKFAGELSPGQIVAMYGTLGAGKTQFTKGICRYFDVSESLVSSPTFTLVNEYIGNAGSIYHFDAYRIEQVSEFFELGYEEYFFGDGICLIEWPDHIEALLPNDTIRLRFTHLGEDKREIKLV
ncbi:MAG: tRNA (adenosine(37)-N6)-threonylcarbamoyltransferase complex ATPase subunit type 1 TsaE [Rhodothermales bacterium]